MILYSVIMFAVAALLLGLGTAIRRGNTDLIHDYHRTHVRASERLDYGRAFAKGLFVMAAGLAASGVIALFGTEGRVVAWAVAVLLAGLVAGIVVIVRVQMRYNGGL